MIELPHQSFQVVRMFEECMCEFTGAPFAIAVDNCTNAIKMCAKLHSPRNVQIPEHTYIAVAQALAEVGHTVTTTSLEWTRYYRIIGTDIFDAAPTLLPYMFRDAHSMYGVTMMCLSFGIRKPLPIGKGGMILTNDETIANRLRRMRWLGRTEGVPLAQERISPKEYGYNAYMTPDYAARGIMLLEEYIRRGDYQYGIWSDYCRIDEVLI